MKSKIVTLVLTAICLPMFCLAQVGIVETITVGEGTNSDSYLPLRPNANFSTSQQIYTAAEIGMQGTIKTIAFYQNYGSYNGISHVKVYLKHVTRSTFESNNNFETVSTTDLYYDGAFNATGTGWQTVTLNGNGFEYNGTDNLLICFYDYTDDWVYGGYNYKWRYTITEGYTGIYKINETGNSGYNPEGTITSGTRLRYHCNLQLGFASTSSCSAPTNLRCNATSTDYASLSWTQNDNAVEWSLQYKETSGTEWTTITLTQSELVNGEYILNNLNPNTEYAWQTAAICSEDETSAYAIGPNFSTEATCPKPTALTVCNVTAHKASLNWTSIAEDFFITVNQEIIEHVTNPYTLINLLPETTYTIKIQAICSSDDLSDWSEPITFTTDIACPAPTNLNVSNLTSTTATLSWEDNTNATAWQIILNNDENNLIEATTNPFVLENLTPETNYTAQVRTICGSEDGVSTWSNTVSLEPTEKTIVGTNSALFPYLPSNINCNFSYTQQIYTIEELGEAGLIESIDFYMANANECSRDLNIYLVDTYKNSFDNSNDWIAVTENDRVYSGTVDFVANGWTTIVLDEGFIYDASKNIALIVDDNTNYMDYISRNFRSYTTTANQALVLNNYYNDIDPNNVGNNGNVTNYKNQIRIFKSEIACFPPTNLETTDITTYTATLNWDSDAESYNVSYFKAYFFESFEEDLSGWTILKEGDDGSTEWNIENPTESSSDLSAHSGISVVSSESYPEILTDNWLISPQIALPNQATLKFWIMRSTYDDAQDEYEVLLSTTSNAIEDFTVIKEKTAANSEWTEVSIDLSAYDGQQCYIAIRHEFTNGFYLMVDDFGIFGWSEPIATTETSLLIEDLLPETEYQWKVQANCGDEDGLSRWSSSSFTTLPPCPTPIDLIAGNLTAGSVDITWTGSPNVDSYTVRYRTSETIEDGIIEGFEDGSIPASWAQSGSGTWTVGDGTYVAPTGAHGDTYYAMISNSSGGSETYLISPTMDLSGIDEAFLSFWYINRPRIYVDVLTVYYRVDNGDWNQLWSTTTAHNDWTYQTITLEGMAPDYQIGFKIKNYYGYGIGLDDINIAAIPIPAGPWTTISSTDTSTTISGLSPNTEYEAIVKSDCVDDVWSDALHFTTLDDNVKVFVTEGEWSDDYNWVPVGVPTIDENVILRAGATIFDVAEANAITIEGSATLTIEDGGQLKTNSDVTATMKKFVIGYGTDYVETDNGYYLMTLPTVAPVSAADAGLLTEESDYDLYSWDRTATDEEWQNNHDGIDLQNGVGFLYANRDDMEMFFTATLRNSSEPVVVTPSYDEVEHGGWNLCGNPFPCEAYITTDAEGMAFYRLVDNQLELIEGAIAPLEAFFVKATAAGQTFTISREAPAK